jgi:diguanylate cyclase (GGDEF)-like protein
MIVRMQLQTEAPALGAAAASRVSPLARISALPDRIRSSEYVAVGTSPRFRALQRRRTVAAARTGILVIAAAAAFDGALLLDRQPGLGVLLLALNGAVALLGIAGWRLLAGPLRRWPDPVATAVTIALTGATAATGIILPPLAIESAGYLILIPVVVTLILPWSTTVHVRWLAGWAAIAIGFLVVGPSSGIDPEARGDLIIVDLVALWASLAGHALLQLAAIRNHVQVRKITQLRRRADANMQELARVHRRLEDTASTDALTGARNRLRLADDLRIIRARMSRLGDSHGLIAFDLDRFKQINDERGHLAGDAVLKAVIEAVRKTIRADEEVYRFGGEEFLVLIRVDGVDGMRAAADRIRETIAELAIPHPGNVPHGVVTVSVGAALLAADGLAATDDEWFARADAALYAAKDAGRNRVVIAA